MSNLLKSMAITFAMYSKIPVRSFKWEKENMKYCLLFLPVVGIVEGIFLIVFSVFFYKLRINPTLVAAFLTVFPILYTGGIHMDGFLDTMDALGSNQDKQKKLAILKDSNSGAFAIIGGLELSKKSLIYTNRAVLIIFILLGSAAMIIVNVNYGLLCAISTFLVFLYYRVKSFEEFGGITGDLAGYFLQLAELVVVLVLALAP